MYSLSLSVMDELFLKYEIQSSCLYSSAGQTTGFDARTRVCSSFPRDMFFMQAHYKTDLILISVGADAFASYEGKVREDVFVRRDGHAGKLLVSADGKTERVPERELTEYLYRLLT